MIELAIGACVGVGVGWMAHAIMRRNREQLDMNEVAKQLREDFIANFIANKMRSITPQERQADE